MCVCARARVRVCARARVCVRVRACKRVEIFHKNERHWQAIRDRVRQWVLNVYATWQALVPPFFTADLQARIPDDSMPAQVVQDLNAQSPDGRRPTAQPVRA